MAEITCRFCDSTRIRPLPPTTPSIQVMWYCCEYCRAMFSNPQPALVATKQPDAR
jgi:hypothetical protein